jgi:hypothetical protein
MMRGGLDLGELSVEEQREVMEASANLFPAGPDVIASQIESLIDIPGPGRPAIILETPRLLLRHLELTDLPALYALYRDQEIRQYFPDGTLTLEETREELEWFLKGHPDYPELGLWATVEKCSGVFLGRCGLLPWLVDGQREVERSVAVARRVGMRFEREYTDEYGPCHIYAASAGMWSA